MKVNDASSRALALLLMRDLVCLALQEEQLPNFYWETGLRSTSIFLVSWQQIDLVENYRLVWTKITIVFLRGINVSFLEAANFPI